MCVCVCGEACGHTDKATSQKNNYTVPFGLVTIWQPNVDCINWLSHFTCTDKKDSNLRGATQRWLDASLLVKWVHYFNSHWPWLNKKIPEIAFQNYHNQELTDRRTPLMCHLPWAHIIKKIQCYWISSQFWDGLLSPESWLLRMV